MDLSILNSKVSVQRDFSEYLSCEYTVLWSVNPLYYLPSHPLLFNIFQYFKSYVFDLHLKVDTSSQLQDWFHIKKGKTVKDQSPLSFLLILLKVPFLGERGDMRCQSRSMDLRCSAK
jgi:hypothetical protein